MHEHHQVEKIVKELLVKAEQKQLSKVNKVVLAMGDMLGFDDTSVGLYFESFTEATIAENAVLEIKHIPGELNCPVCHKNFIKKGSALDCPTCKVQGTPTEIGKEFFVAAIE